MQNINGVLVTNEDESGCQIMKILISSFLILISLFLFGQKTVSKEDTIQKVNLEFEGLDLNWIISKEDYKFIDSLLLEYKNGNKEKLIKNLSDTYRENRKKSFEICYFIAKEYVLEEDYLVRDLMRKLLFSTGEENWNTGFCHIYPFIFYKNFEVLTLNEKIRLYELINIFSWTDSSPFKKYEINFPRKLKRSIVLDCGGKYFDTPY